MLRRRLLPCLVLALLAAAPAGAWAHLSPMPDVCNGNPDCITKGGGGDTTVSPTLVHVGGVLTIKLTSRDHEYGGVADWTISTRPVGALSSSPALKLLGCKGRNVRKSGGPYDVGHGLHGSATCRYRVLSSGRGWQAAVANFSVRYGGLASYSEAAWRVVPKGSFVEGHVRGLPRHKGEAGVPLVGVQVVAKGRSSDSQRTNNQGYYVLQLAKPGRYEVYAKRRASDQRIRPVPELTPRSRNLRLDSSHVKDADFRLSRHDDIRVRFLGAGGKAVSEIPANGVSSATVLIEAVDANDQPIEDGNSVDPLDLSVDGARLASKAILCSPNNVRIWPGAGNGPQVDTHDPSAVTPDAHGRLQLTLYAGTQAGTVTITARVPHASPSDPGRTESLTLRAVTPPVDLPEAARFARSNYPSGPSAAYPQPQPLDHSGEGSWWQSDLYYLADAKSHGYFAGWEYLPLVTTSGSPQSYGIYFYRNGNQGGGGVLETDNRGFAPLESGNPLPSIAQWAAGRAYQVQQLAGGYPGDGLFYGGWPYERTPADDCIRRGPH